MPFIPDKDVVNPKVERCMSPEHLPPTHRYWDKSGTWICPICGKKTRIEVDKVTC